MGNAAANRCRPPMKIHKLHGKNLRITGDRHLASRFEGYADAMFFGSRTVDRDEQMELTITEMTVNWNGSLRFGFTSHDPVAIVNHPEGIPRFMCPDLVKRGGSFIETLNHIKLRVGDRIMFWVNTSGEVQVKVNDVVQRAQSTKLVTREVWPVIDVYGNAVAVKFRSLKDKMLPPGETMHPHIYAALSLYKFPIFVNEETVEVTNYELIRRKSGTKAYAWNKNPLPVNSVWVLYVNEVDYEVSKNLSIAVLTSPPTGSIGGMPEMLEGFQRSTIYRDVYKRMIVGDELAICITDTGLVMVALNGEGFESLGSVPKNESYWIVADVYCDILSMRTVGLYQMTKYALPKLPSVTENFAMRFSSMTINDNVPSLPNSPPAQAQAPPVPARNLPEPVQAQAAREVPQQTIAPNNETECVICLNEVPDSVFIPCGHICCCKNCADNLMNEHGNLTCPTCRKRIETNIKVYF